MVEQSERGMGQEHVSRDTVAKELAVQMDGKLEPAKIDAAARSLAATETSYGANGNVASMIFYLQFQVNVNGGRSFNGKAGGISSPGGGALFGTVFTDDIDRLYRDTHSFAFQATPVYMALEFFDADHRLLGHFQSGGISTVLGTGGGTGSWT